MKKNMGSIDRVIRLVIAALIFIFWLEGFFVKGIVTIILLIVAGIFTVTSLIGSCPLYSLFGIATCKKEK